MTKIRIGCYIGSWPQNIGNAFFDFGARAILNEAFPEAQFFNIGGAVHWMFNESALKHNKSLLGNFGYRALKKMKILSPFGNNNNSFEIGEVAEVDVLVFAGMSMCREFVENNGRTFLAAAKRGVAVLGLGAGGLFYNNDEVRSFSEFFNKLPRASIITRDDDTFGMFSGNIKHIVKGIDCAFCLPEYFTPPRLALPSYDIENFDDSSTPHPIIDHSGRMVIHTHHDLWGPLSKRYISKPNTMISDVPEDYLSLYSQVNTTYSDRVHACVASLAYGNRARLYNKTPRKSLFTKMGLENITCSEVSLNMELREELKQTQVENAKKLIENMLS